LSGGAGGSITSATFVNGQGADETGACQELRWAVAVEGWD